jgi:hypothetical protein
MVPLTTHGPEFAFALLGLLLQENEMPNRGEFVRVKGRVKVATAPAPTAWPIVAFCALGFVLSLGEAATQLFLR